MYKIMKGIDNMGKYDLFTFATDDRTRNTVRSNVCSVVKY